MESPDHKTPSKDFSSKVAARANPSPGGGRIDFSSEVADKHPQTVKSGSSTLLLIILVLLLTTLIGILVYQNQSLKHQLKQSPSSEVAPAKNPSPVSGRLERSASHDSPGVGFETQPTPDPTANWKTYTNENMNISIKLPLSWAIHSSGVDQYKFEEVTLQGPKNSITFTQGDGFGGGLCLGEIVEIPTMQGSIKLCNNKTEKMEIWRTDYHETGTLNLTNSNEGLSLMIKAVTTFPSQQNKDIILNILSTFQFTN